MIISKHLKIHGKVQGVFFREAMRRKAVDFGVTGWVKNRKDKTVEAVLQGEAAAVKQLVDWAKRGPAGAHVDRLIEAEFTDPTVFEEFTRLQTE